MVTYRELDAAVMGRVPAEEQARVTEAVVEEIGETDDRLREVLVALAGEPSTPEAERIVRLWTLCGGINRHCWPKAGGLEDQDAVVVFWFSEIDALVAEVVKAQSQKETARVQA